MIIDFHTHITAPEIIARRDDYLVRDAWFRDLYANPRARLSSAEDLVGAMDQGGVDQAIVFGFGSQPCATRVEEGGRHNFGRHRSSANISHQGTTGIAKVGPNVCNRQHFANRISPAAKSYMSHLLSAGL